MYFTGDMVKLSGIDPSLVEKVNKTFETVGSKLKQDQQLKKQLKKQLKQQQATQATSTPPPTPPPQKKTQPTKKRKTIDDKRAALALSIIGNKKTKKDNKKNVQKLKGDILILSNNLLMIRKLIKLLTTKCMNYFWVVHVRMH